LSNFRVDDALLTKCITKYNYIRFSLFPLRQTHHFYINKYCNLARVVTNVLYFYCLGGSCCNSAFSFISLRSTFLFRRPIRRPLSYIGQRTLFPTCLCNDVVRCPIVRHVVRDTNNLTVQAPKVAQLCILLPVFRTTQEGKITVVRLQYVYLCLS